jgi:exosortase
MTMSLDSSRGSNLARSESFETLSDTMVAAAHLPLVAAYYSRLWAMPHYQFFPAAWCGVALLAYRAVQSPSLPGPRLRCTTMLGRFVGFALLAAAVFLDSPWLGVVAFLLNGTTRLARRCGRWAAVGPAALMAAVTIRPPLGLDEWFIRTLQRMTAQGTDWVLDVLGVFHLLTGNVIELADGRLLVEEACSGVNSFFAATACMIFYSLWNRLGIWSSLLLCLSLPGWVVFANILRVTAVAILRDRWQIEAEKGMLHDAIGLTTFALTVSMIWSTERLLRFYALLVEPQPELAEPGDDARPAAKFGRATHSATKVACEAASAPCVAAMAPSRCANFVRLAIALLLCGLQVPSMSVKADRFAAEWRTESLVGFDERWCDADAGSWRRTHFETLERDRNSPFGQHSHTWYFENAPRRASFSIDYPFLGWHELSECYEAQGWRVVSRRTIIGGKTNTPFVELELHHDARQAYGRLFFSLAARDGRPQPVRRLSEVDEWRDRARLRWEELRSGRKPTTRPGDDWLSYQVQLFVEAYQPFDAADDIELQRWYELGAERSFAQLHSTAVVAGTGP